MVRRPSDHQHSVNVYLSMYVIVEGRSHECHDEAPFLQIVIGESDNGTAALERLAFSARCLHHGAHPSGRTMPLVKSMFDEAWLNIALNRRNERLGPAGEVPTDNQAEVVRNVVFGVIIPNFL